MKSWEWMILFREGWSEKQKLQNDACKVFKGWPQKKTKKKHLGKKVWREQCLRRERLITFI